MTLYNTHNPVGSSDPRDLYDNAIVIDEFSNSSDETATDRLGQVRKTIRGLVVSAQNATGYQFVDDYAAGIELTAYNEVVRDSNGEFWRVSGTTTLPYTTDGSGLPEGGAFIAVGDASLRQELATGTATVTSAMGDQAISEALNARENAINVRSFGVVGNGVVGEDDAAFQAALASSFVTLYVPAGMTIEWSGDAPEIPSNKRLISDGAVIIQNGFDDTADVSTGNQFSGFRIAENAENVSIEGFDIRGPWYQADVTPAYRSIGIAVKGRYDHSRYDNPNFPSLPAAAPSGEAKNISIKHNKIDGFGQSGLLIDNVTHYTSYKNIITNCGRDGERHYGVQHFTVQGNFIKKMEPGMPGTGAGPNQNVYGYSATRIYESTLEDGDTSDYRPTAYGVISDNTIQDCWRWKSLDTHGGHDLTYINNYCKDSYIGIGLDQGGSSLAAGYAPPRRNKVIGNTFINSDAAPYQRAAIFCVAQAGDANNIGEDFVASDNVIHGFGEDNRDGAVVLDFHQRALLSNNIILGPLRSAVSLQQGCREVVIEGGIIQDVVSGFAMALIQSTVRAKVRGVTFRQEGGGDSLDPIVVVSPDAGFGVSLDDSITFYGGGINPLSNIGSFEASPFFTNPKAIGNINMSSGGASISSAKGIQSVTRQQEGVCRVVLESTLGSATNSTFPLFSSKGGSVREITFDPIDERTFDVLVRDSGGALIDGGFIVSVSFF